MSEKLIRELQENNNNIIQELEKGKDVLIKVTPKGLKIQALKITNIKTEGM